MTPPPPSAPTAQPDADRLLSTGQWAQAAALLEQNPARDLRTQLKLRLARNMAAMQAHRPQVYEVLTRTTLAPGRYQLATARDGNLSIVLTRPGAGPVFLSDAGEPSRGVAQIAKLGNDPANLYHVFALLGLGDGYILTWLAAHARPDDMGMTMPVYIVEPEPEVLYQAMMIHDWSGPDGPIAQARIIWGVGPRYDTVLEQAMAEEPQLRLPTIELQQSVLGGQVATRLKALTTRHKAAEAAVRPRLAALYQGHTRELLVELLGPKPPRPPRILCMTSRFTTVVQHATRDLAAAMGRLGWQAELLIEKDAHLAVGVNALLRKVEAFKPDVVFTVNHVRAELFDAFPPNLPFVCWIQDHLPTLMDRTTGAAIGPRDFILSEAPDQYIERFGYPARQCIAMPKLTAPVPAPPAAVRADACVQTLEPSRASHGATGSLLPVPGADEPPRSIDQRTPKALAASCQWHQTVAGSLGHTRDDAPGDDLVYVSHASGLPEQQYIELCGRFAGRPHDQRLLIEHCGRKLLDLYARGDCCPTSDEMHEFVRRGARELSLPALDDTQRDVLCQALYVPLNNALYRQQALGWVGDAADRLGLRLGIYGGGWEQHPRFARHARGKVAFGSDLAELTRRSRINLQIVPYAYYHQRLFDGLMAGGFFLVMGNPSDLPHGRRLEAHGLIPHALPRIEEVCFTDAAGLARQIERYINEPALRQEVTAVQRQYVERYFTYDAGARRLSSQLRELIGGEAQASLRRGPEEHGAASS